MTTTTYGRWRIGPRVWGLSGRWLAVCPWNGSEFWIQLPLIGMVFGPKEHIEFMLGVGKYTLNIDIRWRFEV